MYGTRHASAILAILMPDTPELSLPRCSVAMGQSAAGGLLAMGVGITFARAMSMAEFGEFSAARGAMTLVGLLTTLGFGRLAAKVYARQDSENNQIARGFRTSGPLLILGASLLSWVLLVGFHATIYEKTAIRLSSFAAVLSLLPLTTLLVFFQNSSAAHGAAIRASAIKGWVLQSLLLVLLATSTIFWGEHLTVLQAAAVLAVANSIALIAMWRLCLRVEPSHLKDGESTFVLREWLAIGMTFAIATLATGTLERGGVVVLGWVTADADAAARLVAASQLTYIIILAGFGLRGVFVPKIAEAVANQNREQTIAIMQRWFLILIPPVVVALLLIVFSGRWLLGLFGDSFIEGYPTLVVFGLNYALGAVLLFFVPLAQYQGHGRFVMKTMIIAAVGGLVGMIVLAHYWREFGVAIALTAALSLASSLIAVFAWRRVTNG